MKQPTIKDLPIQFECLFKNDESKHWRKDYIETSEELKEHLEIYVKKREKYILKTRWKKLKPIHQKYKIGQRVFIQKKMPYSMEHFESGIDAIIEGSYSDLFGRDSDVEKIKNNTNEIKYSVFLIKDDKIYNKVSWYYQHQLKLIDKDQVKGLKLITDYVKKNRFGIGHSNIAGIWIDAMSVLLR